MAKKSFGRRVDAGMLGSVAIVILGMIHGWLISPYPPAPVY